MMRYEAYLKGFDELNGFATMNGLHMLCIGQYEDRKLWLCFHHLDGTKNVLAIERQTKNGPAYDLISGEEFEKTVVTVESPEKCFLHNPEDFLSPSIAIAKFIYELDNNRF